MGLRVTGDQSLPVRFLLKTGIFDHAKVAKGGKGILFIYLWVSGSRGVRFRDFLTQRLAKAPQNKITSRPLRPLRDAV